MATVPVIRTVGVVGTGVIGSSWITLFLAHGLKVIVSDPAPGAAERLTSFVTREWPMMEKLGLSENASISNIDFVEDVADHLDAVDFVQENGPESVDFKLKLFSKLDARAPPSVIIASSSSGIPSSKFVTGCTNKPSRVLIGHPFNPPHLIPLVEVVPHPDTDSATTATAMAFYRSLGKRPILLQKEVPGFVANRLQAALGNETYALVARGIVSAADLDAAVTTGLGLRWALTGPLMTNALGGGGGASGFKHIIDHLGPATQVWTKDMDAHRFDWSDESKRGLMDEVEDMIRTTGGTVEELQKQRDEVLIELLQRKDKTELLV